MADFILGCGFRPEILYPPDLSQSLGTVKHDFLEDGVALKIFAMSRERSVEDFLWCRGGSVGRFFAVLRGGVLRIFHGAILNFISVAGVNSFTFKHHDFK